jgi:molybdopterin-guanine dinucleotide biosynthesis protein A
MLEVEGFILVGGASSRMGTDKALLALGGRSFVERVHSALSAITTRTSLVGERSTRARWPQLPTVPDVHVKWGALGGLHAALAACRAEWAAVAACDLPFVTGELFVRLASLRENFDAVVPVQTDGRWQPLCALYRASAARCRAAQLIAEGERRPRALLNLIRTRRVAFEQLNDLPGADHFFTNVNTPADYANAREKEGESDR